MNAVSIIILLGAMQGFLLSFSISSMKRGNLRANRTAALFILLIAVTLLGRYAYTVTAPSLFFSKLLFVGDFVIFFYGPLLYLYFLRLFGVQPRRRIAPWVHFIPMAFFSVIVLPFIGMDQATFDEYNQRMEYVFYGLELLAILQNAVYVAVNASLVHTYRTVSLQRNSALPQLNFYTALLAATALGVLFWGTGFILRFIGPAELRGYLGYQLVWIGLSGFIVGLGYYILRTPEIFAVFDEEADTSSAAPPPLEQADELTAKLERVMQEQRPFLDPKLTLPDLAGITGIPTHSLSRIINERFGRNFFEFVNSYRVEEFKRIATPERLRTMTLFALSLEAGFNSKSTFNAAFKKLTNRTPREYFRTLPQ